MSDFSEKQPSTKTSGAKKSNVPIIFFLLMSSGSTSGYSVYGEHSGISFGSKTVAQPKS